MQYDNYAQEMYADPSFQRMPDASRLERLKLAKAQGHNMGQEADVVMQLLGDAVAKQQAEEEMRRKMQAAPQPQQPQQRKPGMLEAMWRFMSAAPLNEAQQQVHQQRQ